MRNSTKRLRSGKRPVFQVSPTLFAALALAVVLYAVTAQSAPPTGKGGDGGGGAGAKAGAVPAAAADDDVAAAGAPRAVEEITYWEMFRMAGIWMYPLAASSVLALAVIIERFIMLRRSLVNPPGFMPGLKAAMRDIRSPRDREAGLAYCRAHDSSIARMIAAGLRRMVAGNAAAEKGIEDAGANETMRLRKNLRFLYSIGAVATLLGLIGTISGMIKAFQVASAGGMGQAERLSKGIYEAMVCTFAGLAVAVVATFFYYFFVGRVERMVTEINDTLGEFGDEMAGVGAVPSAMAAGEDPVVQLTRDRDPAPPPPLPGTVMVAR